MILLFDLDGTLTDPREGFVRSVGFALERVGVEPPTDEVLATFIGPPLRGTFARLIPGAGPAQIEAAVQAYRERYMDVGIYETRRYDGIVEMLDRLRALAERMFVATSKPWISARRVVAHLGLEGRFDGVYGPEMDGRRDDKGELIAHLLAEDKVPPDRAWMIGDRAADVVAARAVSVEPVGVLWGYGSAEELSGAGARTLFTTPAELTSGLESSRARTAPAMER